MNELRNLLRHLIPGVVFAIELFILIFITLTPEGRSLLIQDIIKIQAGAVIGIGILLVFSGLGYIFSIIHHILYHSIYRWLFRIFDADYGTLINNLREEGLLKLLKLKGLLQLKCNTEKKEHIDLNFNPCGEWRIINTIWYSRIEESPILKGAHDKRDKVSWDIAHGNGAALIGSIFAVISWLYLFYSGCIKMSVYPYECKWYLIIVPLFFIILHSISFCTTIKMAVGFTQHIISNDLFSYSKKSLCNNPVEIIISENDENGSFLDKLFMIICLIILVAMVGTLIILAFLFWCDRCHDIFHLSTF